MIWCAADRDLRTDEILNRNCYRETWPESLDGRDVRTDEILNECRIFTAAVMNK